MGHDHGRVGAADARDRHRGARRSLLPDDRVRHDPAGALAGGRPQADHRRHTPANDSWEWDANLLMERDDAGRGQAGAARPAPDDVQLDARVDIPVRRDVPDDTAYGPSEFWEYLPNATDAANGAGCTTATADKCKSKNCVDGVCCAQTAAECSGKCKSCNVAGKAGTCNNVPAGPPDETCPGDLACDATQQCKALLGHPLLVVHGVRERQLHGRRLLQHRLQRHLPAVQPGRASAAPARRSRKGSRIRRPARRRRSAALLRRHRVCTAASGRRQPCTAGVPVLEQYCVDGLLLQQRLRGRRATPAPSRDRKGLSGARARRADHSATTPCDGPMQYCSGSHLPDEQEAERRSLPDGASDCGSGFCVDGICCNNACLGTCQSCNVTGSEGTCVNPRSASRTRTRRRLHRHRHVLRRHRRLHVGQEGERRHLHRGGRLRFELLRRRRLLREPVHRRLLHLRGVGQRRSAPGFSRAATDPNAARNARRRTSAQPARVHVGQEAERRDLRQRQRLRVELLRD